MATKSRRHTHKYYRATPTPGAQKLWTCGLSDCYHFMPAHYEQLVTGKASICWKCEEPFILEGNQLKMDKPVCDECLYGVNINEIMRQESSNDNEARIQKVENYYEQMKNTHLTTRGEIEKDQIEIIVPKLEPSETEITGIAQQPEIRICKKCGRGKVPPDAKVPLCIVCSFPMSPKEINEWIGK